MIKQHMNNFLTGSKVTLRKITKEDFEDYSNIEDGLLRKDWENTVV